MPDPITRQPSGVSAGKSERPGGAGQASAGASGWPRWKAALFGSLTCSILVLLLFAGTRLWLLSIDARLSDMSYYANNALKGVDGGHLVYRDFPFEYPPLAWWLATMPRWLDRGPVLQPSPTAEMVEDLHAHYRRIFHTALFLADLISLGLTFSIGRRLLPAAPWVLPGAYVLITFAQPYLAYERLDIVLTTFFLLSIDCWLRSLDDIPTANRWATASYLFLGMGISFKLMPLIFVPYLLLADCWAAGSLGKLAGRVGALAVAAVGPVLFYFPRAGLKVLYMLKYHSERGTNFESLWASIMLIAAKFGVPCGVYHSHGGYNLTGDWGNTLRLAATISLVGIGALFGLWALLRGRRYDRRLALNTAILVLFNCTLVSHVFSPQYLIWLFPLTFILALGIFPARWILWSVFVALLTTMLSISCWLFPNHYMESVHFQHDPVLMTIARCACLALIAPLLNVAFFAKYGLIPWRGGTPAGQAAA